MANIPFTQFKGLSDSRWSGIKGAFPKFVGLNIHDTPGIVTVNQALSKISGSTIDALCRVKLSVSNGDKYWFSYTSGKIWKQDSSNVVTLVYTTVPGAGNAGCLGAIEYNGYILWATQSRLHRIIVTGLADWNANAVLNWQTFSKTDAEFHPMIVQNQKAWIGDASVIASIDSSFTFTTSALDLVAPQRAKSMAPFDIDVVIGTIVATTVNEARIVRWDTVQTAWQFNESVAENGVNSFLWDGTTLMAQAGTYGNWYYYDGQYLRPYKRIPGTWSPTQFGEVYPQAIAMLKGIAVFGFSNSADAGNTTGNPADQGIYTMGRYSKDYPIVMNGPEYVISENVTTGIEIGAILVEGLNMFVSWKNGSSYGVDKIDYSAKYASAYIEFPALTAKPDALMKYIKFLAGYASMPSACGLTFKYKINNASSFTTIGSANTFNATDKSLYYAQESVSAREFQLRVEFTVSSNNAPQIEYFYIQTQ